MSGPSRMAGTDRDRLASHLEATYGVRARSATGLDRHVTRVDLAGGEQWVVRLRPPAAARRDVAVLAFLARVGFPAERPVDDAPVADHGGRAMVVTRYVPGVRGEQRRQVVRQHGGLAALGEAVGRLAGLGADPRAPVHPGGAWHHLVEGGGPAEEITAAMTVLLEHEDRVRSADRASFEALLDAVAELDDGSGLGPGLVHPDPVLANVVASPEDGMVFVDWAGSGVGPVLWSLAWLVWAEAAKDLRRADLVLAGYRRVAELQTEDLLRLPALGRARATTIAVGAWHVAHLPLRQAAAHAARAEELAAALADHLRTA